MWWLGRFEEEDDDEEAAAATTAAALSSVNAEVAAAAAFVELLAEFASERWFLNKARWLGGWFNWFRTSATLHFMKTNNKLKLISDNTK